MGECPGARWVRNSMGYFFGQDRNRNIAEKLTCVGELRFEAPRGLLLPPHSSKQRFRGQSRQPGLLGCEPNSSRMRPIPFSRCASRCLAILHGTCNRAPLPIRHQNGNAVRSLDRKQQARFSVIAPSALRGCVLSASAAPTATTRFEWNWRSVTIGVDVSPVTASASSRRFCITASRASSAVRPRFNSPGASSAAIGAADSAATRAEAMPQPICHCLARSRQLEPEAPKAVAAHRVGGGADNNSCFDRGSCAELSQSVVVRLRRLPAVAHKSGNLKQCIDRCETGDS